VDAETVAEPVLAMVVTADVTVAAVQLLPLLAVAATKSVLAQN